MVRHKNMSITISSDLGAKNYKYAHKHFISNTLFLFSISIVLSIFGIFIFEKLIPFLFGEEYLMSVDIIKILIFSVPIRTLGGFIAVFITSPLINKQKLLPLFQFLSTIVFILTVMIFNLTKEIDILHITYANLIGYTFWHLSLIILYIKYFFRKFLK